MIVVKIGGSEAIDLREIGRDIHNLEEECVVVHGGAQEVDRFSSLLGHSPEYVTSVSGYRSRSTPREVQEILEMVLCGRVNKKLVRTFIEQGVNAVGLSGIDAGLIQASRKVIKIMKNGKRVVVRDDYTGKIERADASLLTLLLRNSYVPVISPVGIGLNGESLNIDADRAAATIASALHAETLIFLSDVEGVLSDINNPKTLIPQIGKEEVASYIQCTNGGMRKKLLGAEEAMRGKVDRVIIADGRIKNPLMRALDGNGTTFL